MNEKKRKKIAGRAGLFLIGIIGILAGARPALPQASSSTTDPLSILRNYDLNQNNCQPQNADINSSYWIGCCGAPGRRMCATSVLTADALAACLKPDPTLTADLYTGALVCSMPAPGPDPGLGAAFSILANAVNVTDFTLYVTSDIHYFRTTFNLTDQLNHVSVLNNFGNPPWPSGTGIPAGTPVNTPTAVIVDGDITTHSQTQDLGAFRMMYEEGTLPGSIRYPVLFGLGNHDESTNSSSSDAHRLYDYLHARMGPNVHMDPASGNYSWDWQGVHMLQLNTWAGDQTSLYVHSSDGLTWLANDLAQYAGNTATPVMIFQHYGTQAVNTPISLNSPIKWWPLDSNAVDSSGNPTGKGYESFWKTIQNYNVIGLFSGHDHCLGATLLFDANAQNGEVGATFPAAKGYGVPVDNYDDGSGGDTSGTQQLDFAGNGNPCGNKTNTGIQEGTGSFLTTRVTKNYLDVAAVSWTGNGAYFDPTMGFNSGQPACRKRINSQFAPVTGFVVTSNSNSYTVTNNTGYDLSMPIALQFNSSDGATGYDFVDNCSGSGAHSYILVNGETSLTRGQTFTVPVSFQPSVVRSNPQIVALTPLSGSSPNQFNFSTSFAAPGQTAIAPPDQSLTVYGAAGQAFTISPVYLTSTTGWITATPVTGNYTFDQFGYAVLNVHFVAANLQATQEGHVNANLKIITTATGITVSVPIEVTFKAPVTVTLTPSLDNWFNPSSGANAEFTAGLSYTVQNGEQITGIVSLRTQTIDPVSGQVTGTSELSNAIVNSAADCPNKSPADNTVVFGGTGTTGDYCPSNIGASNSNNPPFVFNLGKGLYNLAAYYEGSANQGDNAYAPAVSPTILYRVGDPLTGIAISSGNSQSAAASSYFNQVLTIQVYSRTANNGGPANVPVTFTVIPGSNGAAGTFNNGATEVTIVSDVNGLAVTPPVAANGIQGVWGIVATVPDAGIVSATFNLTNTAPSIPPAVTTTITNKTGPSNARVWTFQFKDSGPIAAGNVTLTALSITPVGGVACNPGIVSGVPSTIPLVPTSSTGTLNVVLNFSSCPTNARFSVLPSVSASGVTMAPVLIGNQFQ